MNIEFFGLDRMPFRSPKVTYAGPQQLALAGGLKRSLIAPDSVVAISGPVGVGKTVSVQHAIERMGTVSVVARIGRIYLHRDELLEHLLDQFKVSKKPASSMQRFNTLKRLLAGWADVGTNVFVIVEDAERLGEEALAELESLTAPDGDDSPGAHLALLGTPELRTFLERPLLARLRQRIRRSLSIDPFDKEQTRAYLDLRIGSAGASLNDIFAKPVVELIHETSGGIAAMINNVAESLMQAAEDSGKRHIELDFARDVIRADFDWPAAADSNGGLSEPSAKANSTAAPTPADKPALDADDIPALIQDTQPEMPALDERMLHESPESPVEKTLAEEIALLREKTDATQPSLPILGNPDEVAELIAAGADTDAGEELRMRLEPRAPEPLSKSANTADTQTIRALDDALRPDTQLLQTLEDPAMLVEDKAQVPLGLRDEVAEARSQSTKQQETTKEDEESLPTLSDTVLLETAPQFEAEAQQASQAGSPATAAPNPGAIPTPTAKRPNAAGPPGAPAPEPKATRAAAATETPIAPRMAESPVIGDQEQTVPSIEDEDRPAPSGPAVPEYTHTPARAGTAGGERATNAAEQVATPTEHKQPPVPPSRTPTPPGSAASTVDDRRKEVTIGDGEQTLPSLDHDDRPTEPRAGNRPGDVGIGTRAGITERPPEAIEPKQAASSPAPDSPAITESVSSATAAPAPSNQSGTPSSDKPQAADAPAAPGLAPGKAADRPAEAEQRDDQAGNADNELPDLALMPEITLDNELQQHQQEARAKLDAEAARSGEAADASGESGTGGGSAADEVARQKIEQLAARFENARSIEDVMDDTAAETLFGEEFTQLAAQVVAMHELSVTQEADSANDAKAPASSGPVQGAEALTLEATGEAKAPPPPLPQSAPPTTPPPAAAPRKAASNAPTSPKAPKQTPPAKPAAPLDSSAAQRLEMVRKLNAKAGKPMPPVPDKGGEEIVLGGADPSPTYSGPRPDRIEDQFGTSMTATLKALSAKNIKEMQEEEERTEKKRGLLSRFRRS